MIVDNDSRPDYKYGSLPSCAPLAAAYVPMQQSAEPQYEPQSAIARGTLFPGLDLPFRGMVNRPLPATPLGELMALDFVAEELCLYLDTHRDDSEAFEMYRSILALSRQTHEKLAQNCGPIVKTDMLGMKKFSWTDDPWPWEYKKAGEV